MDDDAARLELLEELTRRGVGPDELAVAETEGRLGVLGAELALREGTERLTLAEVAERSGTPYDAALRVWLADGFPDPGDERLFSERDVETFPLLQAGTAIFGEEVFLQLARVTGSSLARIAEAEVSAFALTVGAALVEKGASDLEFLRSAEATAALLPMADQVIAVLHRHHLAAAIRRLAYTNESVGWDQATTQLAVGFADLTGYTAMSRRLTLEDLSQAIARFDALASDTVAAAGGRVVKLIGDEVMFAAPSADAACDIASSLHVVVGAEDALPPLRAGLAYGEVLTREGDYFGPVVNLAARAASAASGGRTLVDAGVQHASARWAFEPAGSVELKGFAEPVELYELGQNLR